MTKHTATEATGRHGWPGHLWRGRIFSFQVGTDQLWLVAIFACFLFLTSLMPLIPNDFWWHLKIGEIIFQEKGIPSTNMFAWSVPAEHPYTYGAWLAEALFYLVYKIGKMELVFYLRNLLAAALFGLLAFEVRRRSESWRLTAGVVALAWLMILNNLIARPQVWSWLPFMAHFMILSRYVEGRLSKRWLAALPILMVFWVNAHGAFVLGIFLIGAYLIGETLARLFRLPGAISWRDIRWLGFTGLAALLAMLVNPNSTHIFGYVFDLLTDQPSQELIQEWRSPTPSGVSNLVFFASISLLILGLAYSRYRPSLTENLLLTGLMWLAWTGQRYIVWYALVAAPVLAAVFAGLPVRLPRLRAKVNRLNLILAVVLFLPAALAQPWFVEKINLPEVYGEPVIRGSTVGPLLSMRNPVEAAAYLLENPGGRLFNEMGYGSYLIWALPGRSVFIDPRVELYPFEQWQDYIYISHGVRYNQLLEKYGADRILLDKELQPELAGVLASDPSWEKEYEDRRAQIWRRK
jgi:hypothetical protein